MSDNTRKSANRPDMTTEGGNGAATPAMRAEADEETLVAESAIDQVFIGHVRGQAADEDPVNRSSAEYRHQGGLANQGMAPASAVALKRRTLAGKNPSPGRRQAGAQAGAQPSRRKFWIGLGAAATLVLSVALARRTNVPGMVANCRMMQRLGRTFNLFAGLNRGNSRHYAHSSGMIG